MYEGVRTSDGTALSATDYTALTNAEASFSPGVDFDEVTIAITEDDIREDTETFTLSLTAPSGGVIGDPSTATVFILDESCK